MCTTPIPAELYLKVDTRIDKFLATGSCEWLDEDAADDICCAAATRLSPLPQTAVCRQLVSQMHQLPPIRRGSIIPAYNWKEDRIAMPYPRRFRTPQLYHSTLFHEAIHSTGHPSRLNRFELLNWVEREDPFYCREELIAEHGAAYLCTLAGIERETFVDSVCCIDYYLARHRPDGADLSALRTKAREAVTYLLSPPQ